MSDTPEPKGKVRRCPYCGADMGFILNSNYDRRDSCGAQNCEQEARNDDRAEREEAHERLDRDMGW